MNNIIVVVFTFDLVLFVVVSLRTVFLGIFSWNFFDKRFLSVSPFPKKISSEAVHFLNFPIPVFVDNYEFVSRGNL
jgi:hypothetical protein